MTAIDIFILVVAGVGAFTGYTRGVLTQVGSIAAVIIGVVGARLLGGRVTALVGGTDGPGLDAVAGYGITFMLIYAAVWLLSRVLRRTVHAVHLGIVDRLAGAAFKVLQWGLILSLALNLFILVKGDHTALTEGGSPLTRAAVKLAPATLGYLADITNNHDTTDVNTPISNNDNE